MTKTVLAEYLADEQKLKLDEPLEGVEDHARVRVSVETQDPQRRPWLELRGTLPPEAIAEWKRAIEHD
ncbi:MAG TPA: hypothetical protein VMT00_04500 [Thermoanaerobaculia bacterium]|nr:hypothetical protein [Thermoanaerobaculia bacterium]